MSDLLLSSNQAVGALSMVEGVTKKVLANGMTVLVKELHTAPVVAVNAWVKVGSVHEHARERGITHFIEHMLFKGTERISVGQLDRLIKAAGGYNNAHTRYETTDFIDVLPSAKLDVALETMADALRNSTFDAAELEREKQVVLEELHRGQDNPGWEAWNRMTHLAFQKHPYSHPIIGYKEVVEAQDRDLLVSYWRRFYRPANLVFVVAGDVKAEEVLAKVEWVFAGWEEKAEAPEPAEAEPAQKGLRSDEFSGDIQTTVLMLGVRGPSELDPDGPAMEMALAILGQGLSSRLNREVREKKKLVQDVSAGLFNGRSPGLCYVYAELEPGQLKDAVAAIWEEVEKMKKPVEEAELARQRVGLEFSQARERMSMDGLAGKLGYYEALAGDYRQADVQTERMRQVSPADVARVMEKYFRPDQVNLVAYRPAKAAGSGLDAKGWQSLLEGAQPVPAAVTSSSGSSGQGGFIRTRLKNGLTLLVKPSHHTPLVSLYGVFKAGQRVEPKAKAGAWHLLARMGLKGTAAGRSPAQVAEALDDLGASISFFSDQDLFGFAAQSLSAKFPQTLALASELLREPAFREDEFQKEKSRTLKDIKDKKDDADDYVEDVFKETLFTRSPYARPVEGTSATVRRLGLPDLKKLHRGYLHPNNLTLALVGDIEPEQARLLVEEKLGPAVWKAAKVAFPAVPSEMRAKARRLKVERLKKKQAHLMVGWLGARPQDPDYFAFRLFNSVLGEGMNSRLFTEVRDKRGLVYTVHSYFDRSLDPGALHIYLGTRPENEEQALRVVLEVVSELRERGVTAEELESAKAYAKGIFEMARQDFSTEARLAGQYEFWGMGAETLGRFPSLIDRVTLEQVKAAARKYTDPEKPTIAILRP
jgi:zinc protease